jgi:hypothetical protein
MFVTTLCLALYLAAIKRRQELLVQGSDSRRVLAHYSVALVSRYAEMAGTGALVFYGLFVVTSRPDWSLPYHWYCTACSATGTWWSRWRPENLRSTP